MSANPLASERIELADGNRIPVLGLGTWLQTDPKCTDIVRWALDVGYRHIDTAETYENQHLIGPALHGYDREELFITSKLWRGTYGRDAVEPAVDKMLTELKVDYLDLLLIHWPDKEVPIAESLEAMQKVQQKGKVRSLGMSNSTERHIQDCLDTGVQIVVNQIEFHPYFVQTALKEFCEKRKVHIEAYSPLAHGKVIDEPVLIELGKRRGKTAAQVAIRWLLQLGCIVLPKASNKERLEQNAKVFDFELSSAEMGQIAGLHRNERQISPTFQEFDYI